MVFWVTSSTHSVHPPLHSTRLLKCTSPKQEPEYISLGSGGLEEPEGGRYLRSFLGESGFVSKFLTSCCPGLLADLPQPWTLAGISPALLSLSWRWQTSNHCPSLAVLHCSGWDSSSLSLPTSHLCQSTFTSLPKPTGTLLYSLFPQTRELLPVFCAVEGFILMLHKTKQMLWHRTCPKP